MRRRDPSPQLIEAEAVERRRGCTDLVLLDPDVCANCGVAMVMDTVAQPALFRHGGYGETQRGTTLWCPSCGWRGAHRREAENPRERPHKAVHNVDSGSPS